MRTILAMAALLTVGMYGRSDQDTSALQPYVAVNPAVTSSTRRRIVAKCAAVSARIVPSSSTELGITLEAPTPVDKAIIHVGDDTIYETLYMCKISRRPPDGAQQLNRDMDHVRGGDTCSQDEGKE